MKKFLISLTIFFLLFGIVFRSLILNITTNLIDWADPPLGVWIIHQNITKILELNFQNYFDTNIYYPHKGTLLFSDITLPQVVLGFFPYLLTKNLIYSFNMIFILTFLLNFASLYLFWKQIFKRDLIAFFGSLFFIFNPYFYLELSHLPELTYWPIFFTLYLLFKQKKPSIKTSILVGLGVTIQFLAGVYLSVFLIFAILVFYFLKLISLKDFKPTLLQIFVIFFVFFLTSGVFIKGYVDIKTTFNVKRGLQEYVLSSANLSDYLFSGSINSVIHQSFMAPWNKLNRSHNSLFPGFLILTLVIFSLFKLSKIKQSLLISVQLNKEKFYFLILIVTGLIFSLGPRLNFNSIYNLIPLPYSLLLKFIPLLDVVRVPIRWSFLLFLGLTYFSLISLSRLTYKSSYQVIFLLIFVIFTLEYVPFNLQTAKKNYVTADYKLLKEVCSKEKKVLMELPLTHLNAAPNIREGLSYITTLQLSSTYHECNLINGYSGYDIPENFILAGILDEYIKRQQTDEFIKELKKQEVDIVKFNQSYFIKEVKPSIKNFITAIATQSGIEKLNDDLFLLYR